MNSAALKKDYSSRAFGVLLPLIPGLAPTGLILLTLSFIALKFKSVRAQAVGSAAPYLLLLATWVVAFLSVNEEFLALAGVLQSGGSISLFLAGAAPQFWATSQDILRISTILLLYEIFSKDKLARSEFWKGVYVGLVGAILIFTCQYLDLFPFTLPQQSDFWTMQGRYSSTFSDPNACGIFLVLILPILFEKFRASRSFWPIVAAVVSIGILCGSRSFVLGGLIYVLFLAFRIRPRLGLVILLGALAVPFIFDYVRTIYEITAIFESLPLALRRIVDSISIENFSEAIYSRSVFWRVDLAIWEAHSVFGSGPNSIHGLIPSYAAKLGENLGVWTDNANSFYLEVLAETGLAGVALLAFSLSCFRWRSSSASAARLSLSVLLLLFIFGPHLDFWEVAVLCSALMGEALQLKVPHPAFRKVLIVSLILIPIIIWRASALSYGFYRVEKAGAQRFRWTRTAAQGEIECRKGRAELVFAAPSPADIFPVTVKITTAHETKVVDVTDPNPKQILLLCGEEAFLPYHVRVSKGWIPGVKLPVSTDFRLLGIQILGL